MGALPASRGKIARFKSSSVTDFAAVDAMKSALGFLRCEWS
jgi:hypothetical protein